MLAPSQDNARAGAFLFLQLPGLAHTLYLLGYSKSAKIAYKKYLEKFDK